jgi:hypothetical protein
MMGLAHGAARKYKTLMGFVRAELAFSGEDQVARAALLHTAEDGELS